MPDHLKHAPNLLILPLVQQYFIPGVESVSCSSLIFAGAVRVPSSRVTPRRSRSIAAVRRHAFDFDFINFLNSIARGSHEVGEVAIVG